jgi:hypothetical protein
VNAMLALCMVTFVAGAPHASAQTSGPRYGSPASTKDSPRTIDRTVVVGTIEAHTIRAALAALPRRPERIEVVAADEVLPEIRDRIHRKFGFVLKGSRTIYLIRDSAIIRAADRSGGPYLFMLAAVIWHEMAHADGLDEAQARRREEELWRGFVSTRVVDATFGLEYLAELRAQK